jgi:hypothetical protein
MLLEGTDAKVHFIPHDDAISAARKAGHLKPNSFVRLSRASPSARQLTVLDRGDAEALVNAGRANQPRQPAQPASEKRWGGWLGRYQARVTPEGWSNERHR